MRSSPIMDAMLLAGFLVIARAGPVASPSERDAREAATLLPAVVADIPAGGRCAYGEHWDHYPIPGSVARRYLGLTTQADVSPSSEPLPFKQALDPGMTSPSAFCSPDAAKTNTEQNLERFAASGSRSMAPLRTEGFTFPVFDRDRRTAIVVVILRESDGRMYVHGRKGLRKTLPESWIAARVFRKVHNRWRLLVTETLVLT